VCVVYPFDPLGQDHQTLVDDDINDASRPRARTGNVTVSAFTRLPVRGAFDDPINPATGTAAAQ
jgi:hypothetical protein